MADAATDNAPEADTPRASGGAAGSDLRLVPLTPFKPDLYQRAWASIPHPTLPLIATTHAKAVTIFSLSALSSHSALTGGHQRSVRSVAWKPNLPPHRLCLVTGSFDSTAGLWRWDGDVPFESGAEGVVAENSESLEVEITSEAAGRSRRGGNSTTADADADSDDDGRRDKDGEDWEFTLVLEGHDSEVKSVAFAPSGQYLATCSRDKSVWIWEDVGASEADDEWETVAVLNEHDGDVKAIAWCPDVPGRTGKGRYGADVLASASYDNTVRVWREDGDGEWVCVAVLEGHEATVWGLQWEPAPRHSGFPRLLTWSADMTLRIWSLKEDEEDEGAGGSAGGAAGRQFRSGLGGIPNTMRRSLREDWECTTVLPKAHTRDIYSATWSAGSGMVASTGSDGVIAVYQEEPAAKAAPSGGEVEMPDAGAAADTTPAPTADSTCTNGRDAAGTTPADGDSSSNRWRLLTTMPNGHGPYEINHITWCKRFDPGSERRGVEEMLVTTGDDGIVRPWQVIASIGQPSAAS